jgi:nitrogenase subunit NifH
MFDDRTNLAQQVMNELKNYFGEKLCTTTIPRNIRLAEAPSHGKAALVYDPRSKGAESYIRLAKEIIERQAAGVGPQGAEAQASEVIATEEIKGDAAGEEAPAPAEDLDKTA